MDFSWDLNEYQRNQNILKFLFEVVQKSTKKDFSEINEK